MTVLAPLCGWGMFHDPRLTPRLQSCAASRPKWVALRPKSVRGDATWYMNGSTYNHNDDLLYELLQITQATSATESYT